MNITISLTYRGLSYYYYYLCSLIRTQHKPKTISETINSVSRLEGIFWQQVTFGRIMTSFIIQRNQRDVLLPKPDVFYVGRVAISFAIKTSSHRRNRRFGSGHGPERKDLLCSFHSYDLPRFKQPVATTLVFPVTLRYFQLPFTEQESLSDKSVSEDQPFPDPPTQWSCPLQSKKVFLTNLSQRTSHFRTRQLNEVALYRARKSFWQIYLRGPAISGPANSMKRHPGEQTHQLSVATSRNSGCIPSHTNE